MEEEVGIIEHWYGHLNVAGIKIVKGSIQAGDTLHFKGHTTDFSEVVPSIQIDNQSVPQAKAGERVGVRVSQKVREHDKVFRVT